MKLSAKQIGIIITALATAYLHLSLFPVYQRPDPIVLNGLGYIALLGAYFLPISFFQQRHKLAWWGLVGYTALTLILWIAIGEKNFNASPSAAVGYYAKVAELFLLGFLFADKPTS